MMSSLPQMILAKLRYEASVQPGMHESYSQMFPEPRQEKLDAIGFVCGRS